MADTPAQAALRAAFNTRLPTAGGTMTGALILSGDPSNDMEAVTKQYVDNSVSGISWDSLQGKPNLATVATTGSYNDLINTPSFPPTPNAYVTTTWKSGSNLYRIWSDGYKQQIIYVPRYSANTQTVSLLINMSNTSYAAFPASLSNAGADGYSSCFVTPVSTNSVNVISDFIEYRSLFVVVEGY